jgi:hypothetical protein
MIINLKVKIKSYFLLLFCFIFFKSFSQNVKLNNSKVVKLGKIEISEEELTKFGKGPDRIKAVEVENFLANHPEWRLPTIDELLKMYDERNNEYHPGVLNNMIPDLYLCYGLNSGAKIPEKYSNSSWYNKASSKYFSVNFNGGDLDLVYGYDCYVRLIKTNNQPISDNTINNNKEISNTTVSNNKMQEEQNCDQAKRKYLEQNPDVTKAGMDAWSHYTIFGKKEGRKWPSCSENEKNTPISNLAKTTYKIKRIEVQNSNSDSWYEVFTGLRALEIYIDENKNITFQNYNGTFMDLLAGKSYIGIYDELIFLNSGLDKSDSKNFTDGYNGKLKLSGNNNLPTSKPAYAYFVYYPNTRNLGLIQIENFFCGCILKLFIVKN